ncbi:sulfurtransferase-like selenium metabolism protein YedF [Desulfatitalea tepidiphila]|uniref:sulfurtransferase-like selenium metabolism protein YedF n=1 Tax=Desulfatitalea tepidiphila TaxID=1185843 RepID=UPI0006B48036|nr:sulfurtransferase-like selenium metabolism protein YedF [Desulfatitalea tepidiphila]
MKEVDARGLSCPAPVLQTKAILEQEPLDTIKVIVDNAASQQNVERFLKSQGFKTTLSKEGDDFTIVGKSGAKTAPQAAPAPTSTGGGQQIMVMCTTDRMGFGDDELGLKLMVNFIRTLKEMGPDLWRLVLVNNGVKLTIEGSAVLSELQAYEKEGITILVCGTCLEHFKLLERKQVGITTNMLDIVTAMQLADKVISI